MRLPTRLFSPARRLPLPPSLRLSVFRFRFRFLSVLLTTVVATTAAPAIEFPDAAQPQLAATATGRVYLTFGRGPEIFIARSDDAGATFAPPVRVAALPSLMLGRRRGPRIAAHGDTVTITAMAGELFAFHSKDAGKSWRGPVLINDVPRSAREGLHALAVAPDGRLFTTWLDLRDIPGARTQLFASESADGGATWSANALVYRAPAGHTVCECCHPSAHFNARGDLAVMWRNGVDGARDMWSTTRLAGTKAFSPATKLGTGTWLLQACPMDGGSVFTSGDTFTTIWQRAGSVFLAQPGSPEIPLGPGTQPVAATLGSATHIFFQRGPDLIATRLSASVAPSPPAPHAQQARFPSLLALPDGRAILLAYEQGPAKGAVSVVVETLAP
jgi:hypothetical protein